MMGTLMMVLLNRMKAHRWINLSHPLPLQLQVTLIRVLFKTNKSNINIAWKKNRYTKVMPLFSQKMFWKACLTEDTINKAVGLFKYFIGLKFFVYEWLVSV